MSTDITYYKSDDPMTCVGSFTDAEGVKWYAGYAKTKDGEWLEHIRSRWINTIIKHFVCVAIDQNMPNAPILALLQVSVQDRVLSAMFKDPELNALAQSNKDATFLEKTLDYPKEEKDAADKPADKKTSLKPRIIVPRK